MTFTPLEHARDEIGEVLRRCEIDGYARDHLVKAHAILQEQCRAIERAEWAQPGGKVYDATKEEWVG